MQSHFYDKAKIKFFLPEPEMYKVDYPLLIRGGGIKKKQKTEQTQCNLKF